MFMSVWIGDTKFEPAAGSFRDLSILQCIKGNFFPEKYAARFKGGLFEELESEENVRLARDPKYYLPQYPGKYPYGGYGGYPNYDYPKHPYGYYGNHHYPVIPPKKNSPTTTTGNTDSNKSPPKPYAPSKPTPEGQVPIIYNNFEGPLPTFSYSYITGNGIQQSARYS